MTNNIEKDTEIRMIKCVETFKNQISKIHVGRASSNLLNEITVEYYGKLMQLSQFANVTVENSNTLKINIFDTSMWPSIEKAIIASGLGLNPVSTGNGFFVRLPLITEENRKNMIKIVCNEAEKSRIVLRGIRREANFKIKTLLKEKKISKDDDNRSQVAIQKLTDSAVKSIDTFMMEKKNELMRF